MKTTKAKEMNLLNLLNETLEEQEEQKEAGAGEADTGRNILRSDCHGSNHCFAPAFPKRTYQF